MLVIAVDDPCAGDVRALLEGHLTSARTVTPPEGVHALDVDGLLDPAVTFFSARIDGVLVGVGALKQLDEAAAEVKSMHTVEAARRRGVGRAILGHLLAVAVERRCRRVSLETGTMDAFAPARALYTKAGFTECPRFGSYPDLPSSMFMTIDLASPAS